MSDPKSSGPDDPLLNPALRSRIETTHDTDRVTPAPYDSASSTGRESEGWTFVWLAITLISIALALYFIL